VSSLGFFYGQIILAECSTSMEAHPNHKASVFFFLFCDYIRNEQKMSNMKQRNCSMPKKFKKYE
jgi:hypothetical protein